MHVHTHTHAHAHTHTHTHTHTHVHTPHTHTHVHTPHTYTQHTRHVGVLYIRPDCTFKIDPIPLTTIRPFVMESVCLRKTGIPPPEEERVSEYLSQKV